MGFIYPIFDGDIPPGTKFPWGFAILLILGIAALIAFNFWLCG